MKAPAKSFSVGFAATVVVAAILNWLPYLQTRGAYNGDGFEVIGFPFTFRRLGGIAGIYEFRVVQLLLDIILALLVAAVAGCAFARNQRTK
jgi:hypothetical protein